MSRIEVEEMVNRVLERLLKVDSQTVADATRSNVPKWTSLMHIEIFFALEEETGVRLSEDDMAFSESRNDLVEAVLKALPSN
jgi:acyl carrier protein